ncbi:RNA 2',3'-cyclic phosphodiesterase [Sulfurimicrobium lacus]|uniref:RNA 2',3'-cyclic phosphodiesterase n=1 Tax=Sulfurimicrobium lacus TaxID=2715678 RepID=A0A6F8V9V7_9PROT|nr:RNA 2',3'-cyclic phosphodiesterase [Sulfurimicrobium lacus]BCB25897.1 RNA 2',3'-cyclic phosphodiesterase [Sulfurimicrobium lacus]
MRGEGQARLFFALWPDAAVCGALDQAGRKLRDACGGRQMRCNNIHLTLVFLGNVEITRIDALRAVGDGVALPPFVMTLNQLGWWRHNRVAWAAPDTTPGPLLALVNQLQDGLRVAAFAFDDRPVYAPHVTLLRNARCEKAEWPAFESQEWVANEFVLVRSVTREEGATYEAIGRWSLG